MESTSLSMGEFLKPRKRGTSYSRISGRINVQNAADRAQNAWDSLQCIRNPQYIADRIHAGETFGEVVRDYNNVSTHMMRRFLAERLGDKWRGNGAEIDWDKAMELYGLGYDYAQIAEEMDIGLSTAGQGIRRILQRTPTPAEKGTER